MTPETVAVLVTAIGGFVAAIATAAKSFEESRKTRAETRRQGKTIDAIAAETQPNHGGSLRDVVDRIECAVIGLGERVTLVESRAAREHRAIAARIDELHPEEEKEHDPDHR